MRARTTVGLVKMQVWVGRPGVGPEIPHFSQGPRGRCCCSSEDRVWGSRGRTSGGSPCPLPVLITGTHCEGGTTLFAKLGGWSGSIGIPWKIVKSANARTPSQTSGIRIYKGRAQQPGLQQALQIRTEVCEPLRCCVLL